MQRSYKNTNNSRETTKVQCYDNPYRYWQLRGMTRVTNQTGRLILDEKKTNEMVKTVLLENESITSKVLSGLIQEERLKSIC